MRTSPLLLGALLAAALALPTTASAAATPSCFGGLGGTYNDYTIVGTGKAEVLVGTPGPDVIYAAAATTRSTGSAATTSSAAPAAAT